MSESVQADGPRRRPKVIHGTTEKISLGCNRTMYVIINEDDDGLCEVFLQLGKSGGCIISQLEALARMISLALRSGIEPKVIIKQLKDIRCPAPLQHRSCSDAVAKAMGRYLGNTGKLLEGDEK